MLLAGTLCHAEVDADRNLGPGGSFARNPARRRRLTGARAQAFGVDGV